MKEKEFTSIVGTALCDYTSIPDPDNGYSCKPCPYGFYTASLQRSKCLSCNSFATYHEFLTP